MLTFLIAQICILSADLNTIAPLITMFFMITYGLLNLATFYEVDHEEPQLSATVSLLPLDHFARWAQPAVWPSCS